MPRPKANPRVANGHRRRQLRAQVLARGFQRCLRPTPGGTSSLAVFPPHLMALGKSSL
jgi:hypothetical protein